MLLEVVGAGKVVVGIIIEHIYNFGGMIRCLHFVCMYAYYFCELVEKLVPLNVLRPGCYY